MPFSDSQVRTLTCDAEGCEHTLTFALSIAKQVVEAPGNEWVKTGRVVNTGDGRALFYCSDVCEARGIATGKHNPPEPKKIIDDAGNTAAVAAAAAAAKAAEAATKAIKAGNPVTL